MDHGLLRRDKKNQLKATSEHLATPSGIPSRDLRNHHAQILRKAEEALERVPVEERDFSATTMAISASQLAAARAAMKEFRRTFCKGLQEIDPKDRVYCFSMQLFPLDNNEE
jgi:uncharacterized protein (TIGR02147 family)